MQRHLLLLPMAVALVLCPGMATSQRAGATDGDDSLPEALSNLVVVT